ncbi:hypothetical protein [Caulobacter sp. NIBR1757]|uniref:hypothetical protein n=1 Tax=Caulobacter sp. NIBR1757 TaxID=3016000 RepID=UPI0022F09A81|nr:hypothetical protein [Caulobacter sp. NIBR1757]
MDAQRFEALADAHGGVIARWPAEVQDAAYAWLAQAPEAAQAVLTDALALDEALDVLRPPQPSMALRDRILAAAPRGKAGWSLRRWLTGAGVGAALAAASAAGVMIGTQVGTAPAEASDEAVISASSDDDWIVLPDTESQS